MLRAGAGHALLAAPLQLAGGSMLLGFLQHPNLLLLDTREGCGLGVATAQELAHKAGIHRARSLSLFCRGPEEF